MKPFSNSSGRFILYRLPVIALCVAIFWQSSFPGVFEKPFFPHDDKVMHFLAYALLSFLTARDLSALPNAPAVFNIRLFAIIFSSLYGASDEIHQAFVPGRDADPLDFLADSLGSVLGAYVYLDIYLTKIKRRL